MTGNKQYRNAIAAILALALGFLWGYAAHSESQVTADWGRPHAGREKLYTNDGNANATEREDRRAYAHDNRNLTSEKKCTEEQRLTISKQLRLSTGAVHNLDKCQDTDWLDSFFEEVEDIGSGSFLGISVGCNKGNDAVVTARMGMMDPKFDGPAYKAALGPLKSQCNQNNGRQTAINFPARGEAGGNEMHCIEPMPNNYRAVRDASAKLGLGPERFVVTQAAVSSRDGVVRFPDGVAGYEAHGIDSCDKGGVRCVDVEMYSLDSYVEKFVRGMGPVNVLSIDVEGWDFDVLFGASSVLDRTYYLDFEYHSSGNWGNLHLQDAVKLLNTKGFSCYWIADNHLWRITECYFDVYDAWHAWSNVGCVHRSYAELRRRMEDRFDETLADPMLGVWCGACDSGKRGTTCDKRVTWIMNTYGEKDKLKIMRGLINQGHCTN